jgi:hypothetical protein
MRHTTALVRLLAPLLGAALHLAAPAVAFADEPVIAVSHYVVITNDGSTYQGELVESVVGGHVTLRLATGEIVHFDARDIKSQGSALPSHSAPVVVAPPPPPRVVDPPLSSRRSLILAPHFPGLFGGSPTVYEGPDAVPIHITSRDAASATLAEESASGWVPVCQIPCTTSVDPKAMYQLQTMPGLMVPSAPFRFPAGQGPLDLEANVRSRLHNMGWGIGLVTGGPLVALPGIFMLSGMFDGSGTNGVPGSPSTAETVVGWTLVGASAVIVVAGVVLLATPGSTTLTDASGHRIARREGLHLGGSVALTGSGLVF